MSFEELVTAKPNLAANGLVTLAYRSLHSFMRPSVRMPRGFCRPAMNGVGVDCRTH